MLSRAVESVEAAEGGGGGGGEARGVEGLGGGAPKQRVEELARDELGAIGDWGLLLVAVPDDRRAREEIGGTGDGRGGEGRGTIDERDEEVGRGQVLWDGGRGEG